MKNDASRPGRAEPRRGNHRRRAGPLAAALIAVGLLAVGLLAAACGGPAGPGVANAGPTSSASPSTSGHASALAYSRCMRAHGITKYPDPDKNGDIGINGGPGTGLDPNSPQFKAADQACKHLMPAPNPSQAAKNRPALLRYARCMRAHGIPDFPDPNPQGGLAIKASQGSDLDPNNPIYKAADRACKHYMPGGGHGGSTHTSGGGGS
jgi:hypothetical protein